jgi:hypothetical protein
MPSSKRRKQGYHHAHPHHAHGQSNTQRSGSKLILASAVFFALTGLGIAFFAADGNVLALLGGAAAGAAIGFLVGKQIAKAVQQK